jgi:hypothetical protein
MKNLIIFAEGINLKYINQLIDLNLLPYTQELFKIGSFANVKNCFPNEHSLSYTTFLTGKNPAETGFFGDIKWNSDTKKPQNDTISIINSLFNKSKLYPSLDIIPSFNMDKTFLIGGYHNFPANYSRCPTINTNGVDCVKNFNIPILLTSSIEDIDYTESGLLIEIRIGNLKGSCSIEGPYNTIARLKVEVIPDENRCNVINAKQSTSIKIGEVSEPFPIVFKNKTTRIYGYTSISLLSLTPHFNLFLSPITFQFRKQSIKMSKPSKLGKILYNKIGPSIFSNPRQIAKAYVEGMIDFNTAEQYLHKQLDLYEKLIFEILEYKDKLSLNEIETIIIDIPTLDAIGHIISFNDVAKDNNSLIRLYHHFDQLIGYIKTRLDENERFFLISDTGHKQFNYSISLNKFFYDTGYLMLNDIERIPYKGLENFWKYINWQRSIAFSTGGGKIYINKANPEFKYGNKYENLIDKVINNLMNLGNDIDLEITRNRDVYTGEFFHHAPDILFRTKNGYINQYTDAWTIPRKTIMKNETNWKYEHISQESDGFILSPTPGMFKGDYKFEDLSILINSEK